MVILMDFHSQLFRVRLEDRLQDIVPVVQLAAHAKSSTLYGRSYGRTAVVPRSYRRRTSKFFRLDGLLLFCIIMELRELRYK